MKTKFIPIDYQYFDFSGRNYVNVYGRDEKGKRVCVIDNCDVYLWAILKEGLSRVKIDALIKKISKIKLDVKGRKTQVEKVELHNMNYMNQPVKALKVFATNYKDLHDIAEKLGLEEIEKRRGYDLGFITHYIIEKKLEPLKWYEVEGEMLNNSQEFGGIDMGLDVDVCLKLNKSAEIKYKDYTPKVLAYDIETDELKIGKGEILMLSLVGSNFKKVLTWKKSDKKQNFVEYVKDEAELIEKFVEYVRKESPDFLVGYFSDGFDLPYLKARAEKHNVKLGLSLDDSQPKFSRGVSLTAKTKGIVHIDILRFIRTIYAQYMKSETLTLNDVAKEFLGDTKKDFDVYTNLKGEIDWTKFYEYNLHDSVLTLQLFEKFWPDMLEFSQIVKEPLSDLSRAGLSKYVENYLLHHLGEFKEIPEKRPGYDEIGERRKTTHVEGAFVLEPKPGFYEDIVVFDFSSMHTSIIISMNISRETFVTKKIKGGACIEIDNKEYCFDKKKGFIPELLNELFLKRRRFKAEYKKNPDVITKARSNAFKVLSASVHGYIGFFGARYYSKESSTAILGFVRKFNKEAIEMIEKEGYEVIFGDTDSVGFLRGKKSKTEIKEFLKKLNSKLPGIMEMELEGFFKKGLWVMKRGGKAGAKKKYAMLDEKGQLKIRGFETVRRDWCGLAREVQSKVIHIILEDSDEKRALEYVKEIVKKIKERKIDKKDLMIHTQLKKAISEYIAQGPHVIAAKKMREQEIPIEQGGLINYYIAETDGKKKLVRDKVKLPHEKGEYEIEYYLKNQILPAVENIFEVFGVDVAGLVERKNQKGLGGWMK